jgi:hypothetical protein
MRLSNLQKNVYDVTRKVEFEDEIDRMIVSCILFFFIKSIISSSNANSSTSKELAEAYLTTFKSKLEEMKEKYVSYNIMRKKISNFGKESFLSFSYREINEIEKLYEEKTEIKKFSTNHFSQFMYKTSNLNFSQNNRLSNIHFLIMSPIIKFYVNKEKDLSVEDLNIYSIYHIVDNPGKSIIFGINGISSSKILSDLKRKIIGIEEYLYKINLFDEYIEIFIK